MLCACGCVPTWVKALKAGLSHGVCFHSAAACQWSLPLGMMQPQTVTKYRLLALMSRWILQRDQGWRGNGYAHIVAGLPGRLRRGKFTYLHVSGRLVVPQVYESVHATCERRKAWNCSSSDLPTAGRKGIGQPSSTPIEPRGSDLTRACKKALIVCHK
jgi:hypothetical protein